MLAAAVAGFLLGGSLIIAIGAQNAFVIRQGVLKSHIFWVCLFCTAADAVLIWAGVFGLGALIKVLPWFVSRDDLWRCRFPDVVWRQGIAPCPEP